MDRAASKRSGTRWCAKRERFTMRRTTARLCKTAAYLLFEIAGETPRLWMADAVSAEATRRNSAVERGADSASVAIATTTTIPATSRGGRLDPMMLESIGGQSSSL